MKSISSFMQMHKLKVISTWLLTKKWSKPVLGRRHSLRHMLQNVELVPTSQTWKYLLLLAALKQNLPSYMRNLNTTIDHKILCVKFWGDKMMPDDPKP